VPDRPNVLLIVTDQERYDVSAPEGPAMPQAPDLTLPGHDRLQAEGMRFEQAYTPTSICSSARASLLTGQYPHAHGMLNNSHGPEALQRNLSTGLSTVSRALKDAGYRTSYVGKWHVNRDEGPGAFGFDSYQGPDDPDDEALAEHRRRLGVRDDQIEPQDTVWTDHDRDPTLIAGTVEAPAQALQSAFFTDLTIDALEDHARADGPFLHRLDFVDPHFPYLVPDPYASMYEPDDIEPWRSFADTFAGKPGLHAEHLRRRGVRDFTWERWAHAVSLYFGCLSLVSDQIARVLDALDELGLAEDTLVVHTTDHGDFAGAHRQFNKGPLMYEDTYHIPMHVRWPGHVEAGSVNRQMARLQDLAPTIREAAGLKPHDTPSSRSLVPLLEGRTLDDWPQSLFAEYHGDEFGFFSQRMVATQRYKFIYNAYEVDELYDLAEDPHELHNLIDHPAYRERLEHLQDEMLHWMELTEDPFHEWTAKAFSV
jgi:arylsulfatase A-like enzyme